MWTKAGTGEDGSLDQRPKLLVVTVEENRVTEFGSWSPKGGRYSQFLQEWQSRRVTAHYFNLQRLECQVKQNKHENIQMSEKPSGQLFFSFSFSFFSTSSCPPEASAGLGFDLWSHREAAALQLFGYRANPRGHLCNGTRGRQHSQHALIRPKRFSEISKNTQKL